MSAADKQLVNITNEVTSLTNPKGMVDFASTLKGVIVEQGLYTNIKGKNYVHVEAWQFAGAAMGVIAIVKLVERIDTGDDKEYKYRAEVELHRIENDQLVGSGVAFCSNRERKKEDFAEYAVASMAQTRAVSKAYRVSFGWIMKLAGYEATPHEEMDGIDEKPTTRQPTEEEMEFMMTDHRPPAKTNNVAENAKFMNTTAGDVAETVKKMPNGKPPMAAPTEEQLQAIRTLATLAGRSPAFIDQQLLTIDTNERAEEAIAKLKGEGK